MAVVISWVKTYSSANDGDVLSGSDMEDIQTAIENHSHTTGLTTWLSLTDTPSSYVGQAGLFVRVNAGETGLELAAGGGGGASGYTTSFTPSDLVSGILTVTHNLATKYVVIQVYDNNDKMIVPDEVTLLSATQLTVDLTSYGTIAGTWNLRVVA
jgi:hypothetical protein